MICGKLCGMIGEKRKTTRSGYVITHIELKKINLEFNQIANDLINRGENNADGALARLMKYIEETSFIHDIVHSAIDGVNFDFKKCFPVLQGDRFNIPQDESHYIKAQYDYMKYIIDDQNNTSVRGEAHNYCFSTSSWDAMVQKFLKDAFKPMIDYIENSISLKMIDLEDYSTKVKPNIVQNIANNYGTANALGAGSIVSTNSTNVLTDNINALLSKIIPAIDDILEISNDDKESIKDDLESIQEQVNSLEPKKKRMEKALSGIKIFINNVATKATAALAVKAITDTDWNQLIQYIEQFINPV